MKLSVLERLLAPLAAACFALAGCAADTTEAIDGEDADDVAVSADELSSRAQKFLGSFAWRQGDSGPFTDFQKLTLSSDGTYTAKVDAALVSPGIACIMAPCAVVESGRWSVTSSGGKLKIRVNPSGGKPSRSYFASILEQTRTLTLTRFNASTTLFSVGSTCANVRCTATTTCEMKFANGVHSPSCVPNAPPPSDCVKTGCSGQICADGQRMSTCDFRPEYACFQAATCARRADGQCGWTKTAALTACIDNAK
jgi:hypothetical protein